MRVVLAVPPGEGPNVRDFAGGLGFRGGDWATLPVTWMTEWSGAFAPGTEAVYVDVSFGCEEPALDEAWDWLVAPVQLTTWRSDLSWLRTTTANRTGQLMVRTEFDPRLVAGLQQQLHELRAVTVIGDSLEEPLAAFGPTFQPHPGTARHELFSRYPYHYVGLPSRTTVVKASRGCPHSCRYYCPYPLAEGRRWLPRANDDILQGVDNAMTAGFRSILFRDPLFGRDKLRSLELCDSLRYLAPGHRPTWWFETRPEILSEDLCARAFAAGARGVNVGLETVSTGVRRRVQRQGDSAEVHLDARRASAQGGLHHRALLQLGLPGESRGDAVELVAFLWRLEPDSVGVSFTTPYPGTALFDDAVANQWFTTSPAELSFRTDAPEILAGELSATELLDLRDAVNGIGNCTCRCPSCEWHFATLLEAMHAWEATNDGSLLQSASETAGELHHPLAADDR